MPLTTADCESLKSHAKVIEILASRLSTLSNDELRHTSVAHVILGQIDVVQRSMVDILG